VNRIVGQSIGIVAGLLAALTAKLADTRMPSKVTHTIGDLLAQRVFAIVCGHPDGTSLTPAPMAARSC
jgi:hypothetical protein